MTCIVAGAGWMAADRRITSEDQGASSLVKIAKNPHLIAAACGNATSTLAVRLAVRKGAQLVEDLIEHVDAQSTALVVTAEGRAFKVEQGYVWSCPPGLEAIGTGGDLALGWLSAMTIVGVLDRSVVRRAFRFVEKRRADCGGGVDFRSFER